MCICLNAHSIYPINIFMIESNLYILDQNKGFQYFCKQILNGQGNLMCNKVNMDHDSLSKL